MSGGGAWADKVAMTRSNDSMMRRDEFIEGRKQPQQRPARSSRKVNMNEYTRIGTAAIVRSSIHRNSFHFTMVMDRVVGIFLLGARRVCRRKDT